MTNSTTDTTKEFDELLDDVLEKHGAEKGELQYALKEDIKQLIADKIIEEDVLHANERSVNWVDNNLKAEQRKRLYGEERV